MHRIRVLACLVGLGVAGCGGAGIVQRDQGGGLLALKGTQEKSFEEARRLMASHCGPQGYTVVQEGRVTLRLEQFSQSSTIAHEQQVQTHQASGAETGTTTTAVTDDVQRAEAHNEITGQSVETATGARDVLWTNEGSSSTQETASTAMTQQQQSSYAHQGAVTTEGDAETSAQNVSGLRPVEEYRLRYVCGQARSDYQPPPLEYGSLPFSR